LLFDAGIASSDFTYARSGNDLTINNVNGIDSITVQDWYLGDEYQLDQVAFFDEPGFILDKDQLSYAGMFIDHTYTFNLNDGQVTIEDWGGTDSLNFGAGILPADISVSRVNNDLVLSHSNGTDSVTILDWFFDTQKQLEQVTFTEGTVWDETVLTDPFLTITGTTGNDTLTGVAPT